MQLPFSYGISLSCRKKIQVSHDSIPGGIAIGKVIGYRLFGSGDGEFGTQVTIGCSVGRGGTVTAVPGDPEWASSDWAGPDYQVHLGATIVPVAGVSYGDFSTPPNDDGINFFNVQADDVIRNLFVINQVGTQSNALSDFFIDVPAAIAALNEVPTQVDLTMKPVQGGPYTTRYTVPVSELKIPKTIDLEAA
jgi:hypothetical protein